MEVFATVSNWEETENTYRDRSCCKYVIRSWAASRWGGSTSGICLNGGCLTSCHEEKVVVLRFDNIFWNILQLFSLSSFIQLRKVYIYTCMWTYIDIFILASIIHEHLSMHFYFLFWAIHLYTPVFFISAFFLAWDMSSITYSSLFFHLFLIILPE